MHEYNSTSPAVYDAAYLSSHNSDSNASRQRNRSTKRTRDGCYTCKKRRIKCDEKKPSCQNCLKTNRVCEGYRPKFEFRDGLTAVKVKPEYQNYHVLQQQASVPPDAGSSSAPRASLESSPSPLQQPQLSIHHNTSSQHYQYISTPPSPKNHTRQLQNGRHINSLKFIACTNLPNVALDIASPSPSTSSSLPSPTSNNRLPPLLPPSAKGGQPRYSPSAAYTLPPIQLFPEHHSFKYHTQHPQHNDHQNTNSASLQNYSHLPYPQDLRLPTLQDTHHHHRKQYHQNLEARPPKLQPLLPGQMYPGSTIGSTRSRPDDFKMYP